jgi:hypothetical protein
MRLSAAVLATIVAAALGCGGGGGAEQYDAAKALPPPPPKEPEIDPALVKQCNDILAVAWTAIGPALDKLKVVKTSQVEKAYRETKPFIDRCVKLPKDARDCLTGSTNPVSGIRTCKVNENAKGNARLYAPSLRSHIGLLASGKLTSTAGARLLIGLDGTWKNTWADEKIEDEWIFSESGDLETITTVDGGAPKKTAYTIHFDAERRMKATTGGSARRFTLVKVDKKTFFASRSVLHDAFLMDDKKAFEIRNGGDYILYEDGSCEVVTSEGLMAEAECKHGRERYRKNFTAKYELPGGVVREVTYWVYGKHLVHEKLVECCKFKRS